MHASHVSPESLARFDMFPPVSAASYAHVCYCALQGAVSMRCGPVTRSLAINVNRIDDIERAVASLTCGKSVCYSVAFHSVSLLLLDRRRTLPLPRSPDGVASRGGTKN